MAIAADIRRFAVFADCDDTALEQAGRLLTGLHVDAGDVLMHEHERGGELVLASVAVVVTSGGAVARDRPLDVVDSGGVIGELAALDHARRSATVTALESGQIFVCEPRDVPTLLALPGVQRAVSALAAHRRMVNRAAGVAPVEVRLRDGTAIDLRPILPYDRVELASSVERLSVRSRYLRFFSGSTPTPEALARLADVDYPQHFAWVALAPDEPGVPLVGSGRFCRLPEAPDTAEIALTVVDDYQGRGLGAVLLDAVSIAAWEAGYERLSALVLTENTPMRRLLARVGVHLTLDDSPETVSAVFDIPATALAPDLDRQAVVVATCQVLSEPARSPR